MPTAVTGESLWECEGVFPRIPKFDEETLNRLGKGRRMSGSSLGNHDKATSDEETLNRLGKGRRMSGSPLGNHAKATSDEETLNRLGKGRRMSGSPLRNHDKTTSNGSVTTNSCMGAGVISSKNAVLLEDEELSRLSEEELACLLAELEGPQSQQDVVDSLRGHDAIILAKPFDEVLPSANLGAAALGAIAAFCLMALIALVLPISDFNRRFAERDCGDVLLQLDAVEAERDALQVELAAFRTAKRPVPPSERQEPHMFSTGRCDADAASQVVTFKTSLTAGSASAGSGDRIGHQLHIAHSGTHLVGNQPGAFERPHPPAFDVHERLDGPEPTAVACEPCVLSAEAARQLDGQVRALVRENERLNHEPGQLREAYHLQVIENSQLREQSLKCTGELAALRAIFQAGAR